jgi:hypothetical protein
LFANQFLKQAHCRFSQHLGQINKSWPEAKNSDGKGDSDVSSQIGWRLMGVDEGDCILHDMKSLHGMRGWILQDNGPSPHRVKESFILKLAAERISPFHGMPTEANSDGKGDSEPLVSFA